MKIINLFIGTESHSVDVELANLLIEDGYRVKIISTSGSTVLSAFAGIVDQLNAQDADYAILDYPLYKLTEKSAMALKQLAEHEYRNCDNYNVSIGEKYKFPIKYDLYVPAYSKKTMSEDMVYSVDTQDKKIAQRIHDELTGKEGFFSFNLKRAVTFGTVLVLVMLAIAFI